MHMSQLRVEFTQGKRDKGHHLRDLPVEATGEKTPCNEPVTGIEGKSAVIAPGNRT